MLTYEQDPDVVRWGLQLFDSDPYSNSGYCGTIPQNNTECYENHYATEFNSIEDNELTANSLQQQFSQFSLLEQPQHFLEDVENAQTSFYQQDWFNQSMGNYTFDENGREEATALVTSSACPSPGGDSYSREWSYSLDLMDEYALDGEVGKRLNQMIPIPHIPKINGEIPSLDEAPAPPCPALRHSIPPGPPHPSRPSPPWPPDLRTLLCCSRSISLFHWKQQTNLLSCQFLLPLRC